MDFKKLGLFAAGTLFGTAGIKILTSKDARKVYTEATAAALRAKECVMTTVTNVQEGAGDILADAKAINDQRAKKTQILGEYAAGNEVVHQLIDLALLQNGMLKGQRLNDFLKRSVDLIK